MTPTFLEFLRSLGLDYLAPTFVEQGIELSDLRELGVGGLAEAGVGAGPAGRILEALREDDAAEELTLPSFDAPISDLKTAVPGSESPNEAPPRAAKTLSRPESPQGGRQDLRGVALELRPGSVLGPFQLIEAIGQGGFARVWRAEDRYRGGEVALKVVLDHADSELVERTLRAEFALSQRVQTRTHVLALGNPQREVYGDREVLVMPMELADGGSLRGWLDQHSRLDRTALRDEALDLFEHACLGVQALHEVGHVHLDLKPDNLLLVGGCLKVADFGLSRELDHLSAVPGKLLEDGVGTPTYMAPEQVLAGRPEDVGPAADVWALGVILFELLDGRPPLSAPSARALMRKIKSARVAINFDNIPVAIRPVLGGALERIAGSRTGSAAELLQQVREARSRMGAKERRQSAGRGRWALLAAALVILGLAMFALQRPAEELEAIDQTLEAEELSRLAREQAGLEDDPAAALEAFTLFGQACDLGDLEACLAEGDALVEGRGTRPDPEAAAGIYGTICDAGFARGCTRLGVRHLWGEGVRKDLTRAAELFQQGCTGGDLVGCNNYGNRLLRGEGVPKDSSAAAALYKRACGGGLATACTMLGNRHASGDGASRDRQEAQRLYELGCDGGHKTGCDNLARMRAAGR